MSQKEIMHAIVEKIAQYERIFIFRHIRPDGDCVGASRGLRAVLRHSFPEKQILLIDCAPPEYLSFLGEDDAPVDECLYADALAIVVDTASSSRISNEKFALCREIIKIDHHLERDPYGAICLVEEDASSCCELIVKLICECSDVLKLTPEAAKYLYLGMVTDSGRFRFRDVDADTMRCAAVLLEQGIDTDLMYANLYMKDFSYFKFEAYVYEKMRITENGVAYIYVDKEMQERFSLSLEDASSAVSLLDSIKNSLIWIAFIENGDGTIRARIRSRFVAVNELGEQFRGGGHECACGATLISEDEMSELLSRADELLCGYKKDHRGLL